MAKKGTRRRRRSGVNKAQEIRDQFTEMGKTARPKDVRAALAAKGIEVSSAQVSNIKASLGGGKGRGKRKQRVAVGSNGAVSVAVLLEAKRLAKRMGGVEEAKRALDVLVRLQ